MQMKWNFDSMVLTMDFEVKPVGGLFTATVTATLENFQGDILIQQEKLRMSFPNEEMAIDFLAYEVSRNSKVARERRVA